MLRDGIFLTGRPMDRISPGRLGLRVFDRDLAQPGYTLFSPAFGSREYLIDISGLVIHTWRVEHSQLGELLPNGNLLVDNYGAGVKELTPQGKAVWNWSGNYHHDFERLENGNTLLLTAEDTPVVPGYYRKGYQPDHMRSDVVLEVDRSGRTVWRFSFLDHLEEISELAGWPQPVRYAKRDPDGKEVESRPADWAHTNTIESLPDTPLGREDERFREGNLLFSFRALDTIGVIDRDRERIAWAWGPGILDGQHQPTMVDNGNILLFDNGTYRNYSQILEIEPSSGRIIWKYENGSEFYSPFRSGVQRLDNGNTLICESDSGRIFEITKDKKVVWDYWSPFLGQGPDNQGRHIYRATRYSNDQVLPLFESRTDRITAVSDENRQPLTGFREALRFYQDSLEY